MPYNVTESILDSVKKTLGIDPKFLEFDPDILININAAISTLRQIGIGPDEGFLVTDDEQTYSDFLGEESKEINMVKMYLFQKTKLGFDPPTNGTVLQCLKDSIAELEWRLNIQVDPVTTFEIDEVTNDE